jgi:hypothetical protein
VGIVHHVRLPRWQRLKSVGISVLLVGKDVVLQAAKAVCNECAALAAVRQCSEQEFDQSMLGSQSRDIRGLVLGEHRIDTGFLFGVVRS